MICHILQSFWNTVNNNTWEDSLTLINCVRLFDNESERALVAQQTLTVRINGFPLIHWYFANLILIISTFHINIAAQLGQCKIHKYV